MPQVAIASEDRPNNHRERISTSLTFRLDEDNIKKLRIEAQKQGISLNSFVNQTVVKRCGHTNITDETKRQAGSVSDNSDYPRIKLPRNYKDMPENWLIYEILTLAKYRIDISNGNGRCCCSVADVLTRRIKIPREE